MEASGRTRTQIKKKKSHRPYVELRRGSWHTLTRPESREITPTLVVELSRSTAVCLPSSLAFALLLPFIPRSLTNSLDPSYFSDLSPFSQCVLLPPSSRSLSHPPDLSWVPTSPPHLPPFFLGVGLHASTASGVAVIFLMLFLVFFFTPGRSASLTLVRHRSRVGSNSHTLHFLTSLRTPHIIDARARTHACTHTHRERRIHR